MFTWQASRIGLGWKSQNPSCAPMSSGSEGLFRQRASINSYPSDVQVLGNRPDGWCVGVCVCDRILGCNM